MISANREFSTLQCVVHSGVAGGGQSATADSENFAKIRKNKEKYGRKGKNREGS